MKNNILIDKSRKKIFQNLAKRYNMSNIADAVTLSEVPSPVFQTKYKAGLLKEKFELVNVDDSRIDNYGNVIAFMMGKKNKPKIIITANMDTVYGESTEYLTYIDSNKVIGPSVANNSLGLSTLITLSQIFRNSDISAEYGDIILVCTNASQQTGLMAGMRGLIRDYNHIADYVICLKGLELGEIICQSLRKNYIDIVVLVPQDIMPKQNAVYYATKLMSQFYDIPLIKNNNIRLSANSFIADRGNKAYVDKVQINLEFKTEDQKLSDDIFSAIDFFAKDIESNSECKIYIKNSLAAPGGTLPKDSPLLDIVKKIHSSIDIHSKVAVRTTEVSVALSLDIPAVQIGMAKGGNPNEHDEYFYITSAEKGLEQILLLIDNINIYGKRRKIK